MITVFENDYAELDVGVFPHDYSALGEYHLAFPPGRTGPWIASTVHHSWRGNPSWIITTENGKKVLEQACIRQKFLPMLVTGDFKWQDYQIDTVFRPLSLNGAFGIVFRYQTSRHWYALWYDHEKLQIVVKEDDLFQVLSETAWTPSCDLYYPVTIKVDGNQFSAIVDGIELSAADERYTTGKVGFAGTHPVRFGKISVQMESAKYEAYLQEQEEEEQLIRKKRASLPQPKLWKKIPTPGFGAGKSIRFGDLDNDGRQEILLAQNIRRMRGDNFSEISCLTAIDLDGNVLWQIGEPNPANALVSNDLPMQIHDIDGDGEQEVIFCKDFKIKVVNGKTGELKYEAPTPVAPPHKGDKMPETQYHRITGDSIYFCDLTAQGEPRDMIIKDRYNNIWAYTWDLKQLWHYQGNSGHFPMACDIDGDGKDEILIGYTLLDHDGTVMWSLDIGDHADGVAIGKFAGDDEWQFIIAASDEGMYWVDYHGNIVKHHRIGHAQTATIAPFYQGSNELQVVTVTFWGNPGIIIYFDAKGNILKRMELIAPFGTPLSPVNWDGSGRELILLSGHPTFGGLIDEDGHRVVMFPDDGHPYLCCEPMDLTGDGLDEILLWDENEIWIYTQDQPSKNTGYQPVRQPSYNMSNYRAQLSLPKK
ncbi:MAG: hypothetical protein GX208_01455 [Firmicutes bacterium]|nr:hypothetical protein [Bacillota bacterium]